MHSLLHIDWLSITIPLGDEKTAKKLEDIKLWDDMLGEHFTRDGSKWHTSAPQFGYAMAYTSSLGTIAMFGASTMGLHVIYSGMCLQRLSSIGRGADDIIANALRLKSKATRVDIALDIIGGSAEVAHYERAIRNGYAITSAKSWRVMAGSEGGHTLYIGSRTSERMVRVYDKRAERARVYEDDSAEAWVRIECEFKGDRARDLLRACQGNPIDSVLVGHIQDAIDFPTIPDYVYALKNLGAFVEPSKTKRKLTQTRHWLMTVVARTIAKEAAQDTQFYADLLTEVNILIERLLGKKGDI